MLWVLVPFLVFMFFQRLRWKRELAKMEKQLQATCEMCDLREEFYDFISLIPGDLELILKREEIADLFNRLLKAELKFAETHPKIDHEPAIAALIRWKQTRLDNMPYR